MYVRMLVGITSVFMGGGGALLTTFRHAREKGKHANDCNRSEKSGVVQLDSDMRASNREAGASSSRFPFAAACVVRVRCGRPLGVLSLPEVR